jgi:cytochrome c
MNKTVQFLIAASIVIIPQSPSWAQEIDVGKTEYLSSCGTCHGVDGKGKGPTADQLKVAPADLTQLAKKNGGIFPLNAVYEKIDGRQEIKAHGSRDMPIWGYRYTPLPNVSSNQAFNPKASELYLDLSYDPEVIIRGRILALVDYLYRIQDK